MKKAKDEILAGKTRSIMSVKSDIVGLMRIMYLAMGMSRPKAIETAQYSRYSVIIKQMNLNTTNSEEDNQLSELEKTKLADDLLRIFNIGQAPREILWDKCHKHLDEY